MNRKFSLGKQPIHLGLGARAVIQPAFTGAEWYEAYGKRNAKDGVEGRLVTMHTFSEDWSSWEMHPEGEELVVVTTGRMTVIQETKEGVQKVSLGPGDAIVNERGVWHTAKIDEGPVTALFITAGWGTELR